MYIKTKSIPPLVIPMIEMIITKNSGNAITAYLRFVGGGYDDKIKDQAIEDIEKYVEEIKSEHFDVRLGDDIFYDDAWMENPANLDITVSGFMKYDFSPFEEYWKEDNFIEIVSDALEYLDIYVDGNFKYNDSITEDGVGFYVDTSEDYASTVMAMYTLRTSTAVMAPMLMAKSLKLLLPLLPILS